MALRVWLPLNGSVENKGISDITVTNNGATVDNNGKIGKCYNFNGSSYMTVPFDATNLQEHFSIAVWVKFPDATSGNKQIIAFSSNSGWGNVRCTMLYRTASAQALFSISDGTNYVGYNFNITVTPNIWQHLCVTFKDKVLTWYLNGEFQKTYTTSYNPKLNDLSGFGIGGAYNGAEKFTGYLNDVRIYDHCLSAKEVKEISQGLVLHYKLDGSNQVFNGVRNYLGNSRPYYTGYDYNETNKLLRRNYNRNSSSGNPPFDQTYDAVRDIVHENGDQFRRIIISSDRDNTTTNNYQIMHPWIYSGYEKYTNDGSFWSQIQVGDKISFSCYVKSNNYFLLKSVLRIFTSSSNYAYHFFTDGITYGVDVGNLNEWYKLSSTLTVSQELYNLISNWDEMTRFMLIMQFSQAPNVSIASENIVIDFKEYMLEFSGTPHDWVPAPEDFNIDETKVTDSSGYGNDGTIVGTLTAQQNSNRYNVSTYFNGSSYITVSNPWKNGSIVTEFTHTAWIKWDSNCSTSAGIHSIAGSNNFFRFSLGKSNKLWAYGLRSSLNGETTSAAILGQYGSTTSLVNGQWYFIAVTFKDGICKCYCDGELVGTVDNSATYPALKSTIDNLYIGSYNGGNEFAIGNVVDSRMYCTALSAEDILDIYHTSANVDNLGNLHGFEMVETHDRELITGEHFARLGITSYNTGTAKFDENGASYTGKVWAPNGYINSDYIEIKNTGYTYYYDVTYSNSGGGILYIGFERFDANKTATSNSSCVYIVGSTAEINNKRITGIVNLAKDVSGNDVKYIRIRILTDWNNSTTDNSRTVNIKYFSLKEVPNNDVNAHHIYENGVYESDTISDIVPSVSRQLNTGLSEFNDFIEK